MITPEENDLLMFLAERPRLRVHPHKVRIAEVHDGVPFLGVVVRQG